MRRRWRERLLAALLAALLVCASLPMGASAAEKVFYDVSKNDWFAGHVYALFQNGIAAGITETSFAPRKAVTRAEFLTMLAASVCTSEELSQYKDMQLFTDASSGKWFDRYVNWAASSGIAAGDKGKFLPNLPVTREQAAIFALQFAKAYPDKVELKENGDQTEFTDADQISDWAKSYVDACHQAGIFSGDNKGKFNPQVKMDRGSAAVVVCALLGISPLPKDKIPEPPYREPTRFSKSVAGVSVSGVEFNPAFGFVSKVGLAGNKLYTTGSAASIVSGNNGYVAVDGIFFDSYGGATANEIWGTMINQGKILRIYNTFAPQKPTFVVDKDGKASIQYMSVDQTISATVDGQEYALKKVGVNIKVGNNDGTRMVYTKEFGSVVPGVSARALAVNGSGVITQKYTDTSNVPIPQDGYVLMERMKNQWSDDIFVKTKVGDKVNRSIQYTGSSTQNVYTALSCGPSVVKNGKADRNNATYVAEGFSDPHVTSGSAARMAIGVKADGTVVIVSCSCTLAQLGQVMLGLGCQNAMNLDGGASTALYYNGSWLASPGRNLTNMLVFSKR